jgi:hypothetical protein
MGLARAPNFQHPARDVDELAFVRAKFGHRDALGGKVIRHIGFTRDLIEQQLQRTAVLGVIKFATHGHRGEGVNHCGISKTKKPLTLGAFSAAISDCLKW